jgi:hypothetical protein
MLTYRLLSCWIIIPLGLLTYATLRRGAKDPDPPPPPLKPPALAGRH